MYRVRELPPAEWDRLRAVDDGFVPPSPETSKVIVVETEMGEIVGRWFVLTAAHLEGCWVAPKYRGTQVFGRLSAGTKRVLHEANIPVVFSFAGTPDISALMRRVGFTPLPLEPFTLEVK